MKETDLQTQVEALPQAPGVYLFKDPKGGILYIGKAKDLRKRVRSYFQGREQDTKTSIMLSKVGQVDHIATRTEKEALILEDTLIKEHHPRYNIQLRDDKRYPLIRLGMGERFPRLSVVRRFRQDNALYFGPFPSATSMRETLKVIHKAFPLRRCSAAQFAHRSRPCLNFQMNRCLAPCCNEVSEEAYNRIVQEVRLFLEGKSDYLVEELRRRMEDEAQALRFEEAARTRDRLAALERIIEGQKVVSQDSSHRDAVGIARQGGKVGIQILFVRGGKLLGGRFFTITDSGLPDREIISSFVRQFYGQGRFIPQEILVPVPLEDAPVLEEVWGEQRKGKVRVRHPRKGKAGYDLLQMAEENAQGKLLGQLKGEDALQEMKERFNLAHVPVRIEGFDISNLGGGLAVGSQVVFEQGEPARACYRRYRIKTVEGIDDYAMTYEVLLRRLRRGKDEGDLPDLILIDGGKGQLNVALEVLKELGIEGIDALSLAKKRKPEEAEKVFLPNKKEPIPLRTSSPASLLLQRVRDEAHRFAITFHTRLRSKAALSSIIDQIPGIGKTRKQALLEHFKGLEGVFNATPDELAQVPRMNIALAQQVWEHLHNNLPRNDTESHRQKKTHENSV
ncbi:MAG: excinuclease ABC subunit C [Deltaproteobacteria bacterium RBG_16_54_11]|nr:MAG: excinuclease ABC subunit C [Deltaproteobacteria bacterium RBG_16_54_11]